MSESLKVYVGELEAPVVLGRFRIDVEPLPNSGSFHIGRDCRITINGKPIDWALVTGVTLRIERNEAVKLTLDLVATPS